MRNNERFPNDSIPRELKQEAINREKNPFCRGFMRQYYLKTLFFIVLKSNDNRPSALNNSSSQWPMIR